MSDNTYKLWIDMTTSGVSERLTEQEIDKVFEVILANKNACN